MAETKQRLPGGVALARVPPDARKKGNYKSAGRLAHLFTDIHAQGLHMAERRARQSRLDSQAYSVGLIILRFVPKSLKHNVR